ncbi:MAG: hypothetical protein LIP09_09705 [Bacteroidales bacterium]|nr:hypothetical protein [Bacteroidales bacterium]
MPRKVTVYSNNVGTRFWTKAWFSGSEKGCPSVEIEPYNPELALMRAYEFYMGLVDKDEWLEEFYPEHMQIYYQSIKEQINKQLQQNINQAV